MAMLGIDRISISKCSTCRSAHLSNTLSLVSFHLTLHNSSATENSISTMDVDKEKTVKLVSVSARKE
jgi:hypothetical protein